MLGRFAFVVLVIAFATTMAGAQICVLCDEFLAAHNTVRTSGPYGPGNPVPKPPLSPLVWSTSLATTATNWAAGCVWGHNPGRGFVGENLYAQTGTAATPTTAVNFWAAEAQNYNWYTNTCAAGADCSHYTQIVWASTTAVGCAVQICPAGVGTPPPGFTGDWTYVVCNYSPPGNIIGQRPYAAAVPTAGDVSLSGRVVTYEGRGIANARVSISGGGMAAPLVVSTGRRGDYRFDQLRAGETYVVSVSQPRFTFDQPTYTVTMNDNLANANFVAQPSSSGSDGIVRR